MQINGEWYLCDDDIERSVIRGEVLTSSGSWEPARFLVDTGADRTVLSAAVRAVLDFPETPSRDRLGGLGGLVEPVLVDTMIRLTHEDDGKVTFRSQYAAVTDLEALDMSVLGRDITGLFAVIVDRPADLVCLVGQRHRYSIIAG
jgi:aspartyl protease